MSNYLSKDNGALNTMVKDTQTFIEKARQVHCNEGIYYDYSKTEYINTNTKVVITCHKHGDFELKPRNHLEGSGCKECVRERITSTFKEFIERANALHNNKYRYKCNDYRNTDTKVTIICPEHGEFKQRAAKHLKGQGCRKCFNKRTGERTKRTNDDFIKEAQSIHDNAYSYEKVDYIECHSKVIITCPDHGDFAQTPNSHLLGQGCPLCAISFREDMLNMDKDTMKKRNGILYHVVITNKDTGRVFEKIGVTSKSMNIRFSYLNNEEFEMSVLLEAKGDLYSCYQVEQSILDYYKDKRFRVHDLKHHAVGGWTECFEKGVITITENDYHDILFTQERQ